jgi:hypothetical protein
VQFLPGALKLNTLHCHASYIIMGLKLSSLLKTNFAILISGTCTRLLSNKKLKTAENFINEFGNYE